VVGGGHHGEGCLVRRVLGHQGVGQLVVARRGLLVMVRDLACTQSGAWGIGIAEELRGVKHTDFSIQIEDHQVYEIII
jgi:hypothetical protein